MVDKMSRYYIIVYDVDESRVNKVYKIMKQYLFWIQNSVFEGYLEYRKYKEMMRKISRIIDPSKDSIVVYSFKTEKCLNKEFFGRIKKEYSFVV